MMMMRTLMLIASCCATVPAQEVPDILIGTWNIEFLGADPKFRRDTPPRTSDDVLAIGKKIKSLGVVLLAVQEICGEAPLQAVAAATGPGWRSVLGTTGQWTDGKTQQGVGFVYDEAALQLVHAEELCHFPSKIGELTVFHRKPVTAVLRHRDTGCDFRIVIVHLKAGRKARDLEKRKAEATHLRWYVDSLMKDPNEDRDVIIMGDFNSTYGDDPERILENDGGMHYLDHQTSTPTIMWFDTPIDQLCVTDGFREIQRNSLTSHHVTSEEERTAFRKVYSDHFPVTARLTPLTDDDPDATFHKGPMSQALPVTRRPPKSAPSDAAPSQSSSNRDRGWPPEVGAMVDVTVGGGSYRGRLLSPLPSHSNHRWVVINTGTGWRAFPMAQVLQVSLSKE